MYVVKSSCSSRITKLFELSEKNEVHLGQFKNIRLVWAWNREVMHFCVHLRERQDWKTEKSRVDNNESYCVKKKAEWKTHVEWSSAAPKAEERGAVYNEIKAV